MRILVDTNVLLDYLLEREPYWSDARRIVNEHSLSPQQSWGERSKQ